MAFIRSVTTIIFRFKGSRSPGFGPGSQVPMHSGGDGDGERWGGVGAPGASLNEQIVVALARLQEDLQSVLERLRTLEALTTNQVRPVRRIISTTTRKMLIHHKSLSFRLRCDTIGVCSRSSSVAAVEWNKDLLRRRFIFCFSSVCHTLKRFCFCRLDQWLCPLMDHLSSTRGIG